MAPILRIADFVPNLESDNAKQRRLASAKLREVLTSDFYTSPMYGPPPPLTSGINSELMDPPDDVAFKNGGYAVYDQMQKNNLRYASVVEGRIDVLRILPRTFLPGVKGDPESESAAEDIREAWVRCEESAVSMRSGAMFIERGFKPLENVYDVIETGRLKDFVTIIEMIDRPLDWYGFDYYNRAKFLGDKNDPMRRTRAKNKPEDVPDFKVTWGRSGSLHTRYGEGKGERCYPAVFIIDAMLKGYIQFLERWSYLPLLVKYPARWNDERARQEKVKLELQWKHVFMVSADVEDTQVDVLTAGAYTNANATGESRLKVIAHLEEWMSQYYQGSVYSASNQAQGSFARDQVADTARMYKAPSDAACEEVMVNRGFVAPLMLTNRPNLPRYKWPRYAIDSSMNEDLTAFLAAYSKGVELGVPLSAITFYERTKMQPPKPGDIVLTQPRASAPPANSDPANPDPEAEAVKAFTEPRVRVIDRSGAVREFDLDELVMIEGKGEPIRAALLQNGDVPLLAAK